MRSVEYPLPNGHDPVEFCKKSYIEVSTGENKNKTRQYVCYNTINSSLLNDTIGL